MAVSAPRRPQADEIPTKAVGDHAAHSWSHAHAGGAPTTHSGSGRAIIPAPITRKIEDVDLASPGPAGGPGPAGSPPPLGLGRKIGKWTVFTAGFAVFPTVLDLLGEANFERPITLSYLFPASNTYLIGMGIIAGGMGDLLFDHRRVGLNNPFYISMLLLSFLMLTVGGFLYAENKPYPAANLLFPLVYLFGAAAISGVSIVAAARS